MVEKDQKLVGFNQILKLLVNQNLVLALKSESLLNRRPDLDVLVSESLIIQFLGPNCLILHCGLPTIKKEHK